MLPPFASDLIDCLRTFDLKPTYSDEQRDLQPHLLEVVEKLIRDKSFTGYSAIASVGGDKTLKKPKVDLFGTNFWTDIEILHDHVPVIGIEAKIVKPGKSASKAIAESVGQSFIYRSKYPHVIDFILNNGIRNDKYNEFDNAFMELCRRNDITIIIRTS